MLPHPFFSSLLKYFSIVLRMHPRLIRKTEGCAVWIAGIVEIDAIVPTDGFHRRFERHGLGVEIARCMRAACQNTDNIGLRKLRVGHNVDISNGMVP